MHNGRLRLNPARDVPEGGTTEATIPGRQPTVENICVMQPKWCSIPETVNTIFVVPRTVNDTFVIPQAAHNTLVIPQSVNNRFVISQTVNS